MLNIKASAHAVIAMAEKDLRERIGLDDSMEVKTGTGELKVWPDGCLGVEGESCADVLTPGYEMTLLVQGIAYVYHSNLKDRIAFKDGIFIPVEKMDPNMVEVIAKCIGPAFHLTGMTVIQNDKAGPEYVFHIVADQEKGGEGYLYLSAQNAEGKTIEFAYTVYNDPYLNYFQEPEAVEVQAEDGTGDIVMAHGQELRLVIPPSIPNAITLEWRGGAPLFSAWAFDTLTEPKRIALELAIYQNFRLGDVTIENLVTYPVDIPCQTGEFCGTQTDYEIRFSDPSGVYDAGVMYNYMDPAEGPSYDVIWVFPYDGGDDGNDQEYDAWVQEMQALFDDGWYVMYGYEFEVVSEEMLVQWQQEGYEIIELGNYTMPDNSLEYAVAFREPVADTTPPIIAGLIVSDITETGVTFNFNADEPAIYQVEYANNPYFGGSTKLDWTSPLERWASVTLTGLTANTDYYARIYAKDEAGNQSISTMFQFKTLGTPADNTPPVVTLNAPVNVTADGATLSFSADELASYQVEYATNPYFYMSTKLDWTTPLALEGSQALTGLLSNTDYWVRVHAKDETENISQPTVPQMFHTSGTVSYTIEAQINPTGGKDLAITFHEDDTATVVFGTIHYPERYPLVNNELRVRNNDSITHLFRFKTENGIHKLIEMENVSSSGEPGTSYFKTYYDSDGLISWTDQYSIQSDTSSRYSETRVRIYYDRIKDPSGHASMLLSRTKDVRDTNGNDRLDDETPRISNGGFYEYPEGSELTQIFLNPDIDDAVAQGIDSMDKLSVFNANARFKWVSVNLRERMVGYWREADGQWVPHSMLKTVGGNEYFYIVRNNPDDVSGESDDILLDLTQPEPIEGYSVHYGGAHDYNRQPPTYLGHGLMLYKNDPDAGVWPEIDVAVVDYPDETRIVVAGISYDVEVDAMGIVHLTPVSDTTPPIIAGLIVSDITETGAAVNFNADEPASYQIEYTNSPYFYPTTKLEWTSPLALQGSKVLTGLQANSDYWVRVCAKDEAGNVSQPSAYVKFHTLAGGETYDEWFSRIEKIYREQYDPIGYRGFTVWPEARAYEFLAQHPDAVELGRRPDATGAVVIAFAYNQIPLISDVAATAITETSAHISATVKNVQSDEKVWLIYGTDRDVGPSHWNSTWKAMSGQGDQYAVDITDLKSDTEYYYRVVVYNVLTGALVNETGPNQFHTGGETYDEWFSRLEKVYREQYDPIGYRGFTVWPETKYAQFMDEHPDAVELGRRPDATGATVIAFAYNQMPLISDVAATMITETGAHISATVKNVQSDEKVWLIYGTDWNVGPSHWNSTWREMTGQGDQYAVDITDLKSDTEYYYRVVVYNVLTGGLVNETGPNQFHTLRASSDTTPPKITNVTVTEISETGATVNLSADELASYQIEYSDNPYFGGSTKLDWTTPLERWAGITITGLLANKDYYVRVYAKDAAGNQSVSTLYQFKTQAQGETYEQWSFRMQDLYNQSDYAQRGYLYEVVSMDMIMQWQMQGYDVIELGAYPEDYGYSHIAVAFRPNDGSGLETYEQWSLRMQDAYNQGWYAQSGYLFEIIDKSLVQQWQQEGRIVEILGEFYYPDGSTVVAVAFQYGYYDPGMYGGEGGY
ncbi:MAG: fibronectin type III domain-containing protein [Candidatus Omnitrophica bacterium]|nr:fibronectin type III domain-containing protein [Candidatus Omnitrophota bacterium]